MPRREAVIALTSEENVPLTTTKNVPLAHTIHGDGRRRYIRARELESLAIEKYKKTASGITITDVSRHFVLSKRQAELKIKHAREQGVLYTSSRTRPQHYLPASMKGDIDYKRRENVLKQVSGGTHPDTELAELFQETNSIDLLKLLQAEFENAPLRIHKLQLLCSIPREAYDELKLVPDPKNKAKPYRQPIGPIVVDYQINRTGTVAIHIPCTKIPFRVASQDDVTALFVFLGQVKDRLVCLLSDRSGGIVPDVMHWLAQRCDLNKDVPLEHGLQHLSLNLQLRYLDRTFRLYVKPMGAQTVLRAEEDEKPMRPLHEYLDELLYRSSATCPDPRVALLRQCAWTPLNKHI